MERNNTINKKKVDILIPNLANGGAERMASNLSFILSDEYDISFILFDGSKIDYPYSGSIIDMQLPPVDGKFRKLLMMFRRIMKLRKIKAKHKFHITISFLENANVANLFSRKTDKLVLTVHNFNSKRNYGFFYELTYRWLMKAFYNKADRIIAVSQMVAWDMVKNFDIIEEKIEIIYNFINIDSIKSLMNQPIDSTMERIFEKPVIINVGRLYPQKGHIHLIRAFSMVIKKIPDAQLVILGHGEMEQELKALSQKLGIAENVKFLGFQQNPYRWMARSKALVLSSLFEGFGNVLIEAMCCELPVISTDCRSGPREILSPETPMEHQAKSIEYSQYGILTPVWTDEPARPYDISQNPLTREEKLLAEGMIRLLTDEELRQHYILQSKKRVMDFNRDKAACQWHDIINNL